MEKKIYLYSMTNDTYICCNTELATSIIENDIESCYLVFTDYIHMREHVSALKNNIDKNLALEDVINKERSGEYSEYREKIKETRGLI